jgi:hypothetical protein
MSTQSDQNPAPAGGAPRDAGNKGGRPTAYSAEIAQRIVDGLISGRTLLSICYDDGMPTRKTVQSWVSEDREGFAARYRSARELGCDAIFDEILEIADDTSGDRVSRRVADGTPEGRVETHARRPSRRVHSQRQARAARYPGRADEGDRWQDPRASQGRHSAPPCSRGHGWRRKTLSDAKKPAHGRPNDARQN